MLQINKNINGVLFVIETDIIYSSMMEMPDEDYEPDDVKPQHDQP